MNTPHEVAPHGGTWIQTTSGFIEISVFETGVLPHFRLYFFDAAKRPVAPLSDTVATLKTIRPKGAEATQTFSFTDEGSYLQSTFDIPEPHEFDVVLTLLQQGVEQVFKTTFTEEAHGHDHAHGRFGWLLEIIPGLGHSHGGVNIDSALESSERGIWALKISLIVLGATALFQLVIVLISGSVGLLADTIHNFADALTSIPLWIAFVLGLRAANRRYTYGYGRAEDIAGVIIVLTIFVSSLIAGYESYQKIIHPQPLSNVWWVVVAALVGFAGNEAVAVLRIRVGREIGSAALVADGQHSRVDGFTSLAVLFGALGSIAGFPLADPIVGVLITIAILFIVKDSAVTMWHRLMDAIDPEVVDSIERVTAGIPGAMEAHDIRVRWLGHKLQSELHITVDEDLPTRKSHQIAEEVRHALLHAEPRLSSVIIHVDPCGHSGIDAHASVDHHVHT